MGAVKRIYVFVKASLGVFVLAGPNWEVPDFNRITIVLETQFAHFGHLRVINLLRELLGHQLITEAHHVALLQNHILSNICESGHLGLSDILGFGQILVLDVLDLIEVPGGAVVLVARTIEGVVHAVIFSISKVIGI